jgi:type IV pilus assembly protein PilV
MLSRRCATSGLQCGSSLIEVLVTLVILAFGLLGVCGLQMKIGVAEMESYQRAQALLALTQMTERLNANAAQVAGYVSANPVGTGDAQPLDCTGIAPGSNRDLCEWSNILKGTAETSGGGANTGAMVGGLGCITQLQAPNPALGVCTPGVYQVSVAWQGMAPTSVPVLACGTGLYGANDAYRRAIAATVTVPTTSCY